MNKRSVPLIISLSILVSGFVANQAQASPIVDNQSPSMCKLITKDDRSESACSAFKLEKYRLSEESSVTVLVSEFSFKNFRIGYFVGESARTVETNGKTFNVHPMVMQTLKQPGLQDKSSKASGVCLIASDYSEVVCSRSGSVYRYIGNPIRVQKGTETPQISAVNSNQYVFNTNSHINTNISINPGDKIRVEASGRIRFGTFVGSGGPEGILISPTYNYFVDIPHGQLIGRIRQFGGGNLDGWFPIGKGGEFVAKSQGVLEFAVNDNRPRDNSGVFRVEVNIITSK